MSLDLFHPEMCNVVTIFADSGKHLRIPLILVIMCCHHNHVLSYIYLFLCELRDMNAVDWYTLLNRYVIYMVHREVVGEVGRNVGSPDFLGSNPGSTAD